MLSVYIKPGVYLVATSRLQSTGLVNFYNSENIDPEKQVGTIFHDSAVEYNALDLIPEISGRLCYMSYNTPRPGGNNEYLRHILEVDHGSVLEHSNVSFILTGVSRSLTHELVRHRAGMAYSQLSQRYVDESDVGIVIPPDRLSTTLPFISGMMQYYKNKESRRITYEGNCIHLESESGLKDLVGYMRNSPPDENKIEQDWLYSVLLAFSTYKRDVAQYLEKWKDKAQGTELRKMVRQMSRSLLPNCTETKIFVTGNIRAWRHIMKMRGSLAADVEIRRLAIAIFAVLKELAPNSFQDMEVVQVADTQYISPIN